MAYMEMAPSEVFYPRADGRVESDAVENGNTEVVVAAEANPTTAVKPDAVAPSTEQKPPPAEKVSALKLSLFLFLSFIAGVAMAVAANIASDMSKYVGSGIRSTALYKGVGAVMFLFICVGMRTWRNATWEQIKQQIPWYEIPFPGICGAVCGGAYTILITELTFATAASFFIVGQLLFSAIIDHFGWFGVRRESMTIGKVLSVALIAGGAVCVQGIAKGKHSTVITVILIIVIIVNGLPSTLQAIYSNSVGHALRSPLSSAFLVGFIGSFVLGAAILFEWLIQDPQPTKPIRNVQWWKFLAGPINGIFVLISCFAPKVVGSATYFVCMVVGQLLTAVVFDLLDPLSIGKKEITPLRGTGLALVGVGVVIINFLKALQQRNETVVDFVKRVFGCSEKEAAKSEEGNGQPTLAAAECGVSSVPAAAGAETRNEAKAPCPFVVQKEDAEDGMENRATTEFITPSNSGSPSLHDPDSGEHPFAAV